MKVALTRFKRALPYARLSVRELTHTIQFPPAHAELYGGPHAEWLRDCLERLPRLQCLMVNGLPFFDHASLLTLRHSSPWWRSTRPHQFPVFGLRLLDASGCTNATSTGLAEALPHFPDLASLDLSRTPSAKDDTVLSRLQYLRNLRVLNLAGLGLKDADFSIIAPAIGTRVRSLDVSDNNLTDVSARLLLEHCLKETVVNAHVTRTRLSPVEIDPPNNNLDAFESEDLVSHLRKMLTKGFVGSLAIEEARAVGITHLYLSKNSVTIEGVSGLLRSQRLRVLDVGVLPATLQDPRYLPEDGIELPNVAKMTPILSEYASAKLEYLRIGYEIVTEDAPAMTLPSPRAELSGDFGCCTSANALELEASETSTFELDSVATNVFELHSDCSNVFELHGDTPYPVELPGTYPSRKTEARSAAQEKGAGVLQDDSISAPKIEITDPEEPVVKKGPAYAPEPVFLDSPTGPLSGSGYQEETAPHATLSTTKVLSPALSGSHNHSLSQSGIRRSRQNSAHYVEDRRARLDLRQSQENRLHPGMLPKIHTLVLTDVPNFTTNKDVVHRLIQYIKDAAEEAYIAKQRASHTYMLPPGRSRAIAEREHARGLFALRRIVFEMEPPQASPKKISTSWRAYPTKSSTEDPDSERFWEAAAHDFSFFGDEECGLPTQGSERTLPLAAMSGLELVSDHPAPQPKPRELEPAFRPMIDVLGEIRIFRGDRKAAYNNLLQMRELEPDVEGYWPGDITIVRKSADMEAGELDCYGNRYQQGWFYR
jgi:hypothetical protein